MANCPKCKVRLRVTDWKQTCPKCGINLMFYGFEERFYEDAKYAELGFAKARVKLETLRGGLIGSRFLIVRLCLVLLPVLALLVPIGSISYTGALFTKTYSVGALGLYKAFTDGTFQQVFGSAPSLPVFGAAAGSLNRCFLCLALAAVAAVGVLLCSVLSFLAVKRLAIAVCAFCGIGMGAAVACMVFLQGSVASLADELIFGVSSGFGGAVLLVAFAVLLVVNALVAKKGVQYVYKEGDLYRVEIAAKLKRGELTLADIPQPIYETAEEKAAREAAILKTIDDTKMAMGGDNA